MKSKKDVDLAYYKEVHSFIEHLNDCACFPHLWPLSQDEQIKFVKNTVSRAQKIRLMPTYEKEREAIRSAMIREAQ